MKLMSVTREHAEKHYADLKDKPFFGGLCEYSACPPPKAKWLRPPRQPTTGPSPPSTASYCLRRPPSRGAWAQRPASRVTDSAARRLRPSSVASGPVVAMVWCGKDVVKQGRSMIGATNPLASAPGTIRGDFCIEVGRNVIHGSDTVENAQKEIALWFPDGVVSYQPALTSWIYE